MVKKHIKKHKSLCIGTRWFIFIYFLIIKKENPFLWFTFFHFPLFFFFFGLCVLSFSGNEKCMKYLTIYKKQILKNINCENCASLTEKKNIYLKENDRRRKTCIFSWKRKNFISECNCFLVLCALFQLQFMNQQHGDTNFYLKICGEKSFLCENRKNFPNFLCTFFFFSMFG